MKKIILGLLFILASATSAHATARTLCASGCTFTLTAANLQTAINASVGGDEVITQENVTLDGNWTLPSHTGSSMVTIHTGVTSTGTLISSTQFPSANIRVTPTTAVSSHYTIFRALSNNVPVFATSSSIGANGWWTLKQISITGNTYGGEALVVIGSDSNNAGEQDSIARIPANFNLTQVYLYGNPVSGQFRGLRLHANNVTIQDSYIKDIWSDSEGQAIYGNSFTSGLTITNNYVEGASQNVLFGGAGGCCHPNVTVVSATNASTFVVSGHTDAFVGLGISVEPTATTGSAGEEWTKIVSCGATVVGDPCTTNNFVVSPALSTTPIAGGDVDWGVIPSDVTISKNMFAKPVSWRNPIIGTPQSVTAVTATGGTLVAGTYSYRVVAVQPIAVNGTATSGASTEVSFTRTSTGSVKISWAAVTNATSYKVYGRNAGAENMYWTVTAPTTTYTDTGTTGTTGSVPTSTGTTRYVKNNFEIKNGRRMTINGNVFDGMWYPSKQSGYPILFTVANTGHGNDSTTIEDITFSNNIIRNSPGIFDISTRDTNSSTIGQVSDIAKRVTVSNNLAYNIGSDWGASLRTVLLTTTGPQSYYPNSSGLNGPLDFVFDHNTFIHTTGNAALWFDLFKTVEQSAVDFVWTNNIAYKLGSGVTGGNSCSQGNGCWIAHTSGTRSWLKNVVADATCSVYPGTTTQTFCPTSAALNADFTNFSANDFTLKSTSAYHNAASDGTDVGANIATINALTDIAISGDNSGSAIVLPPSITTLSLPNGTVSALYTQDISVTCPGGGCTGAVASGTLPTGATLTTISATKLRISGTTSAAGTFNFSLTATDSGSRVSPAQAFTVTIAEVVDPNDPDPTGCAAIPRSDRWNLDEGVLFRDAVDPCTADKATRVGDIWVDLGTSVIPMPKLVTSLSPSPVYTAFAMRRLITPVTKTTAGVVTYSSDEFLGGLILRDPNGAIRSDVTPTAALIVASIAGAEVGSSYELDIRNTGAFTITMTAGTGVTLSGTMTIAQNNTKRFRVLVTNATAGAEAVTLYSIGSFVH